MTVCMGVVLTGQVMQRPLFFSPFGDKYLRLEYDGEKLSLHHLLCFQSGQIAWHE